MTNNRNASDPAVPCHDRLRISLTGAAFRVFAVLSALAALISLTSASSAAIADTNTATVGTAPDYPQLRYFTEIDPSPYAMSEPPGVSLPEQAGYWFVTAQGIDCGIWFRGSFGCTGPIPGAPQGVDKIGWITGDTRVHYDWTLAIRFPPTRGSATIPPLSYISVGGTTCATTLNQSTYCERGPFRFMITPTHTWLN
ncbi:hypothetical protein ORI20_10370 [Mycobacterium sp. CVI_P3]|uniref:Secreted protein n=1 Tax=Mycobacterium pinniadriaticum TaxID=2994102 RepID=A0ABT3SCJ0_9MYCO|nr:hypothetical protein [Mycobacterium pinniadriaticum]MCX2930683.1 hypothetical protein [Mycobacterium pinniadriaticum]MCX2937107.1 hypothetical protein [Mycobacterium pinniadriaticum]